MVDRVVHRVGGGLKCEGRSVMAEEGTRARGAAPLSIRGHVTAARCRAEDARGTAEKDVKGAGERPWDGG